MLVHSFDIFYVVTKFILPTVKDLNFSTLPFDDNCAYLQEKKECNSEVKGLKLSYCSLASELS